ncbi:MAG: SAF domain-containing protein [Microbacteriaceae bacterium]
MSRALAPTLRRSFRRVSGRTLLGILMVTASAIGVGYTVTEAQSGDPVLVASRFLASGTVVTEADVTTALVSTGSTAGITEVDVVVGRTVQVSVGEGELLTERLFEPQDSMTESLRLDLATAPGSDVVAGSRVTVWSLPTAGGPPPQQLAENATVVAVHSTSLGTEDSIEISIDRRQVPQVLAAVASGFAVMVTHPGGG